MLFMLETEKRQSLWLFGALLYILINFRKNYVNMELGLVRLDVIALNCRVASRSV